MHKVFAQGSQTAEVTLSIKTAPVVCFKQHNKSAQAIWKP